jgi:hypothetical protein
MTKAFIAGAKGFIGAHVLAVVLRRRWRVRAPRCFHANPLLPQGSDLERITGNFRDLESVRSAMALAAPEKVSEGCLFSPSSSCCNVLSDSTRTVPAVVASANIETRFARSFLESHLWR